MSKLSTILREPVNSLTHGIGFLLSLLALILMIFKGISNNLSPIGLVSVSIFGISLCLLYLTSSTYHGINTKDNIILNLRKLDHSMIFVLIAGSYAPYCLISLNNYKGNIFFIVISSLALLGIFFKLIWFNSPRWLQTSLYIILGWAAVFMLKPLSNTLAFESLFLLVLGGVLYTIGGVIYGIKPKKLTFGVFGFHEIFHIFIMLGSLCHFISVFFYII
jgi:hemolysin III